MQQRFGVGGGVEVAHFAPERDVGRKDASGFDVPTQRGKLRPGEQQRPKHPRQGQRDHQCRNDASTTAPVEIRIREGAANHLVVNDSGEQESGQHKEDVDPDKTAGRERGQRVIGDNGKHGNGTHSVDIGSVRSMPRHRLRPIHDRYKTHCAPRDRVGRQRDATLTQRQIEKKRSRTSGVREVRHIMLGRDG